MMGSNPGYLLKSTFLALQLTCSWSLWGYHCVIVYLIYTDFYFICFFYFKKKSWTFYVFLWNVLCCYCSKMSNWLSRISLGIRARMMLHFDFLSPALFSWIALWRISRRPFPNYKLLNTKNFFWITWDLIE